MSVEERDWVRVDDVDKSVLALSVPTSLSQPSGAGGEGQVQREAQPTQAIKMSNNDNNQGVRR